jgi:hypothetical protein
MLILILEIVDDIDRVLLGLRVYTKGEAEIKIAGQLRHGRLMDYKGEY